MSALDTQEGGSHYKDAAIQPVEYIHANGIGYMEGNVIKYVSRWRKKNGVEDLKKARHYIDLLIELEQRGQGEPAQTTSERADTPSWDSAPEWAHVLLYKQSDDTYEWASAYRVGADACHCDLSVPDGTLAPDFSNWYQLVSTRPAN